MTALIIDDHTVTLDSEGYLTDRQQWSEIIAQALAQREGIELTPAHWEILRLLRAFYDEFQLSPANRALVRYIALHLGTEKGNSSHLNRLFNGAPAKLGAKLAGLPKPNNCL